jgi:hypothetical protein
VGVVVQEPESGFRRLKSRFQVLGAGTGFRSKEREERLQGGQW